MRIRNIVSFVLIFFCFVFLLNENYLHAADTPQKGDKLTAWVDKARIRNIPGLKHPSIGNLCEGEVVTFIKKSKNTAEVTLRGKKFISSFYYIERSIGEKGWVYGGALKKYSNPLKRIPGLGDKLAVLAKSRGDYKLETNCWISPEPVTITVDSQKITYSDHGVVIINILSAEKKNNTTYYIICNSKAIGEEDYIIILKLEKDNRIVWKNFFNKGKKIWSTPLKFKNKYKYMDIDCSDFGG